MRRGRFTLVGGVLALGVVAGLIRPSAGQEPIRLGLFAPLSGFAAADGASAKASAEIAVDELNAGGGINGRPVELVVYDDRHDSREAAAIAHKLVERDKVVGVVSGSYSMPSRVTAPVFARAGIPMTVGYAVHPAVTQAGPCVFRNGFLATVEGAAAADALVTLMGARRIAVLTIDDDFGRTASRAFIERVEALGAEVVSEQVYPLGEKEFSPYLTTIREQPIDALYHTSYYNEGSRIVRQARELGLAGHIEGSKGVDSPKYLELAGPAAEGTTLTTSLNRDSANPAVQAFLRHYRAKMGVEADPVGASTYDAVKILARGIAEGGTDARAICRALTDLRDFEGITGTIAQFTQGEVTKPVQVQIVKDGRFRSLAEITDPAVITPVK